MERKSFSGQFVANEGASAADLERGYSDTGSIPDIGESISKPDSARMRNEMAEYIYEEPDEEFKGGFLGRDCCQGDR